MRKSWELLYSLVFLLSTRSFPAFAESQSESLDPKEFHEITFKNITPTRYELERGILKMTVASSSSALVRGFSPPRRVSGISFSWQKLGAITGNNSSSEKTKAGDDLPLRIGLMVAGPAPLIPFFAPSWVKAVRDSLPLSSNYMIYFCVGAKSAPGEVWKSPYAASIETRALKSIPASDGWENVKETIPPIQVVGLWLMGDGDDTHSSFVTKLRDLLLESS